MPPLTGGRAARPSGAAWWQVAPLLLVLGFFFVLPLALTVVVSFWDYDDYTIIPSLTTRSYEAIFDGCLAGLPDLCLTFRTYLSTLKLCLAAWAATLVIGFTVAYFLAFHVRSRAWQVGLLLLCTIPFWTSNVIRMIAWVPLLGRNGLVNQALQGTGVTSGPLDWLLFSEFSVLLAFVHLNTLFMIVPIFNAMLRIDRSVLEAARDAGASGWQRLWNIVVPLSKPGIVIGSIFVVIIVMGDFMTIGVMGGQQIASVGKVIAVQMGYLQLPLAAANAVILLIVVTMVIWAMTRLVDVRREL